MSQAEQATGRIRKYVKEKFTALHSLHSEEARSEPRGPSWKEVKIEIFSGKS